MAKEFEKYAFGALAKQLYERGEKAYAAGALEALAGKDGLDLGEEAQGFIQGAYASENGIQTAIQIYQQTFAEKRGQEKIKDLFSWYNPILGNATSQQSANIQTIFDVDETLGDVTNKVLEAQHILSSPQGMFNQAEIDAAKDTANKYQGVVELLGQLDNFMYEDMRPVAVSRARKSFFDKFD